MFFSTCLLTMLPAAGSVPAVSSVASADGGKLLFVLVQKSEGRTPAGNERWLCIWDTAKPELTAVVSGLPTDAHTIHPTADGKRFVLVGGDRWHVSRLEVWDVGEKKRLRDFTVSAKDSGIAVISPDGAWVAYRPRTDKAEVRVWNTDTGKTAEEVEKTATGVAGLLAFSPDSKRLVVTSHAEYSEYDLTTGKKTAGWKLTEPAHKFFLESGPVAVLPGSKGVVTVVGTGKRRQSYVVRLQTEKKDWFLGEFRDIASAPVLSPDGRWLMVSGGAARDGGGTFVLKLDADGNPELEDRPENARQPQGGGEGKKVPAWRECRLGEAPRGQAAVNESEWPGALNFSGDGKRIFVGSTLGRLHVYDTEQRKLTATLFTTEPKKDALPEWHILTVAGAFVASPAEAEVLAKSGKVKDAAKVKEAFGVK